jgi:hypothetical protein
MIAATFSHAIERRSLEARNRLREERKPRLA